MSSKLNNINNNNVNDTGNNGNKGDANRRGSGNGNGRSKVKAASCTVAPPTPPDGGWGWMIVVSSFMVSVLVDGVCFSAGIFFNPFKEYYGTSISDTAWVGSVLNGSYLTVGPLVSAMVNRYGCRRVAMFGSVFASAALFISTFSPTMPVLIVTYGFLGGVGFGFVYLPAIVMVGYYFEKRRALATGLACCGSGIGGFVFAPLCNFLLELYGWKGATWILAGLFLNALVFSIFYRPLKHGRQEVKDDEVEVGVEANVKVGEDEFAVKDEAEEEQSRPLLQQRRGNVEETGDGGEEDGRPTLPAPSPGENAGSSTSGKVPRLVITSDTDSMEIVVPEIFVKDDGKVNGGEVEVKVEVDDGKGWSESEGVVVLETNGRPPLELSGLIQTVTPEIRAPPPSGSSKTFLSDFHLKEASPVARMAFSQDALGPNRLKKRHVQHGGSQSHLHGSEGQHQHRYQKHHQHHHSHHHLLADRPLERRDIFYSGSLRNIPEFQASSSMAEYRQRVTVVTDDSDDDGRRSEASAGRDHDDHDGGVGDDGYYDDEGSVEGRGRRGWMRRLVCDPLLRVFDVSLLKSPTFVIYGVSCFLCMLGFFVPFIYLPTLCIDMGISPPQAAFLISIIGIANTACRIVVGFVSDQPWADCLLINNIALVTGGVATCLVPLCQTYALFAVYTIVFGSSIAIFVSLRSIIMVELMGLQKLTNAFGLVIMCQGFSSFVGAPIAGALSDVTGDYSISFYMAGAFLALAGVICFPLRRIARWEVNRNRKREDGVSASQTVTDGR